jgi:hypothetical protein
MTRIGQEMSATRVPHLSATATPTPEQYYQSELLLPFTLLLLHPTLFNFISLCSNLSLIRSFIAHFSLRILFAPAALEAELLRALQSLDSSTEVACNQGVRQKCPPPTISRPSWPAFVPVRPLRTLPAMIILRLSANRTTSLVCSRRILNSPMTARATPILSHTATTIHPCHRQSRVPHP